MFVERGSVLETEGLWVDKDSRRIIVTHSVRALAVAPRTRAHSRERAGRQDPASTSSVPPTANAKRAYVEVALYTSNDWLGERAVIENVRVRAGLRARVRARGAPPSRAPPDPPAPRFCPRVNRMPHPHDASGRVPRRHPASHGARRARHRSLVPPYARVA